ncbi:MAG: GNAT family N-acetyltransferase [Dehalococcoidia bacterium]|nr:GNAT family N-acetyltransferase [Dehalococcoidia bacterium]
MTPVARLAPATLDQFDAVADLFGALHAFNASLDPRFALAPTWRERLAAYFRQTVDDPGTLWLLAWAPHPVGLLVMQTHLDSPLFAHRRWAELAAIYVAPEHRGGGLAQALLAAAERWTASRGLDRIQLYVTATNEAARAFYRRGGYRPVQEVWRLDVTPDPDAVVLPPTAHETEDFLETSHAHLALDSHRPD